MNHLHFKKCITILLLVASTYSHSQNKVGIGTENPEGFLHIYGNSTGGTLPHALIEQSTSASPDSYILSTCEVWSV